MTIREQTEQIEQNILSKNAALSINTRGRKKPETECGLRTVYQRDRDRIIHSRAFRGLKHKTQVFLAPEGDNYRTRLTHTLEVSQIARTIARALRLNEDLTEAIALGHDLGHTPFGHAGERALDQVFPGGFKHYEQSVRVVDFLEKQGKGLNLTEEVKNGILCHTKGEEALTLEGRIIRYADRIAYINHDIDDAIRAGVLIEEDIPKEIREILGKNKAQRIDTLTRAVVEFSGENIEMRPDIYPYYQQLHSFMFAKVYANPVCKGEEEKAIGLLNQLYLYFLNNIDKMPSGYLKIAENEGKERAVCDYISSMSDRYALYVFNDVFVPKAWSENRL